MATHLLSGQRAEQRALKYLRRQGLKLLKQNYRCYFGEIDLIMRDRLILVFVEVRFRATNHCGGALCSITHKKIQRICKTAWHYLRTTPQQQHHPIRFDVITLESDSDIHWIKNAFEVQY